MPIVRRYYMQLMNGKKNPKQNEVQSLLETKWETKITLNQLKNKHWFKPTKQS